MSRDSYIKNVKEAAMAGVPCKMRYASAIGLSPSAMVHGQYLESILDIPQSWLPLNTSYTKSDQGGNPGKGEDELSEGGEDTRNRGTNDSANRDY
jgi:hypothetical protein